MLKIIFGNIVRKPKMSSELVVVPLCFELKLIKHRGGRFSKRCGTLQNEHAHTRQEDKAVRGVKPYRLQGLALGLG